MMYIIDEHKPINVRMRLYSFVNTQCMRVYESHSMEASKRIHHNLDTCKWIGFRDQCDNCKVRDRYVRGDDLLKMIASMHTRCACVAVCWRACSPYLLVCVRACVRVCVLTRSRQVFSSICACVRVYFCASACMCLLVRACMCACVC